jgi:HK97 family phage prohead protease
MTLIHKAGNRIADTYDFVLSTEAPDRVGDIVVISGLDTKNFESNPVALYMHNHQEPIGVWSNLKKANGALTGRLNLASKGTSKLIDFAHSMIEQGMLKAVSVSFLTKQATQNKNRGYKITESELVEVSLVTVPMNPQALMIAKSLNFSDLEVDKLFSNANPVNSDQSAVVTRAKSIILAANRTVRS